MPSSRRYFRRMLRPLVGWIHGSFKRFEQALTIVTRHVGPLFVALALLLLFPAIFAFFEVNYGGGGVLKTLVVGLLCCYLAGSMVIFYALACLEKPGRPVEERGERRYWIDQWTRRQGRPHPLELDEPVRACRKCKDSPPKPARTHHCSVCQTCILKYDHHCPWINQCVGLHNERYFVLFMLYLGLDSIIFLCTGWSSFWQSLAGEWPYVTPRLAYLLAYLLAFALGLAVLVMAVWHLVMVSRGETSVEVQDNDFYAKVAREKGKVYRNPYNLGARRNLELFFNVGQGGYPYWTILMPLAIPPYTNGWVWCKRPLWKEGLEMLRDEEYLTDED